MWRNSCYSWPRLVCSQRGETEVRLPLGPWRASTSPASGHAVGTVRLQSAARSRRDKISLARSRRVAARRDEISLKRGSETAQALTGGRRHVQEGVLSSRRLRDRGTSSLKILGTLCRAAVWREREPAQATAPRGVRCLPRPFSLLRLRRRSSLDEVEFSRVRPPNVTDIDRVTNPAASSSRRSPQSCPVRDRTRPRASRSRATRPELTFRFVSSSVPGFRAILILCARHTASPGEDRGPALARGASGAPGAASALVARRRPVCVPVS